MPINNVIPSVRISPANDDISKELGFLAELAGTWHGKGFNLIARPDGLGGQPLFLELNQTSETLRIDEIGSDIPNRGDAVADIDLFGLTYLQKISDSVTGGALHIGGPRAVQLAARLCRNAPQDFRRAVIRIGPS